MGQAKILLVDDDPDLIEAMRLILEQEGYRCVHAMNGARALEALPRERPDLIVLDVMMDGLTEGFDVARKIRRPEPGLEPFTKIPIVILTAIGQRTGMRFDPATDSGFLPVDAYLEKPIQPKDLLTKVGELIGKGRGESPAP